MHAAHRGQALEDTVLVDLYSLAILLVGPALLVWIALKPNLRYAFWLAMLGAGLAVLPGSVFTWLHASLAVGIGGIFPFDDYLTELFFGSLALAAVSVSVLILGWRAWPPHSLQSRVLGFVCILAIASSLANFFWVGIGGRGQLEGLAVSVAAPLALVWLLRRRLLAPLSADVVTPSARTTSEFDERSVALRPAPEEQRPSSVTADVHPAPADVFISYKREERARVEEIANALRALRLSVWFDARLQTGHSFDAEINREVRAAKCVLVCWSVNAVASEWVRAEAAIGRQRGVLAACFLEPCELFPPFNLIHAEDLSHGELGHANPAWVKIVDQIGNLSGRPRLGAYLGLGGDRAAQGIWLAENPNDPLADDLLARLRGA